MSDYTMSLIDELAALIERYPANRYYREAKAQLEAMQAEIERLKLILENNGIIE